MALTFFQSRFYGIEYFRPFWQGGTTREITDTDILQLPVDCVLAGDQLIKDRYRINEVHAPNVRTGAVNVRRSGVKALGGKSGFTVKSGPLGGSHR